MKQFINSLCNSLNNRNQSMKYLVMMAMFFSLSTSVFAEGGARVFEFSYSHRIKFADPSNNIADPLGISNATLTPGPNQVIGGASCIPGIANCVGGSNTTGPTWRVFYNNGVLDSLQDGPVATRVVPGKYYNPNVLSKTDNTFSGLLSLTFVLTKNGNQIWSTTINYADITANASSPFTFSQNDALAGNTWLGNGSIFKDNNGAIHFTSAPLITSTLDENSEFLLTVTPNASLSSIVTTPLTRTYLGETICAAAPKSGETKYSSIATNHEGWYLMDGTPNSSITSTNARAAAQMLFGGAGGNLPNMDGLYTVAETTSGQAYNAAGVVNNEIIVNNNNIQAATINTTTNGSHSHTFSVIQGGDDNNHTGNQAAAYDSAWSGVSTSTSTDGSHNHSVTIGTGSPTPISIQPRSAKLYQFVYLGK